MRRARIMNDDYRVLTSLEELEFDGLIDFHFYWDQLRGERWAPNYWEFDVLELPKIVRSLSIFAVQDDGSDAKLKFNGQFVVDQVGRDITGQSLESVDLSSLKTRTMGMFRLVASTRKPVVSGPRIPIDTLNKTSRTQVLSLPLMDNDNITEIVSMMASD